MANCEEPDEMPQTMSFHQNLTLFAKIKIIYGDKNTSYFKNSNLWHIAIYTTFTNFSMKYLMVYMVYTDDGGIK